MNAGDNTDRTPRRCLLHHAFARCRSLSFGLLAATGLISAKDMTLRAGVDPAPLHGSSAISKTRSSTSQSGGVVPIRAFLIARQGDMPEGLAGPITALNSPISNGLAEVGFLGSADDGLGGTDQFIWRGTGVQFIDSSVIGQSLTGGESVMGIGDSQQFIYSPSVDGGDAVWTHNGLLLRAATQAPGFALGTTVTFNSRPTMTPSGAAYWVAGFNETSGTNTQGRVLYVSSDAQPGTIIPVLRSDDLVGGIPVARPNGIGFEFSVSDDGQHLAAILSLDTGSSLNDGVIYIDGSFFVQESAPNGMGANWDNFDLVAVNNLGNFVFSGDTTADPATDEFVAINGIVVVEEGDTLGGVTLASPATVQAASINNLDQLVHLWQLSGTEVLFFSCSAVAAGSTSVPVLGLGDSLDFNDDGSADATVVDFNALPSNGPGLSLAEDGAIHVEVDLDFGGNVAEAIVRLPLPACTPEIFLDGFESP